MKQRLSRVAILLAALAVPAASCASSAKSEEAQPEPRTTPPPSTPAMARAKDPAPIAATPATPASTAAASPVATSAAPQSGASAAPRPEDTWTQKELEAKSTEIQAQVEALRGEKFARPVAVRVSDKKDFQEYAKERFALTETPEKLAADEMVAKLLGVIAPDMNLQATMMELLEEQVGGFYDPSSDSFSLMQGCPKGLAPIVLSHELDHALDDQLFGIDKHVEEFKVNSDAGIAFSSLVEGSGTAVMALWMQKHMGEVDLSGYAEMEKASQESLAKAPMWLWKPLVSAYLKGAAFLQGSKMELSPSIRKAFESPPLSSEQVLHPEKYWSAEQRDDPQRIAFDTSALGAEWKVLREDTLGELALAIVCTPPDKRGGIDLSNMAAALGIQYTNAAAEGWKGDRVVLLQHDAGRVLRLVTRWDTERDAGEFFGALSFLQPSFEKAARDCGGADAKAKDSDATVEYGDAPTEVVLTIRSNVERSDLKRLLKTLKHSAVSN